MTTSGLIWEPDPRAATEERLRRLIESLNDALLLEDEHRRILIVNQAFCDLFRIPLSPVALQGADCAEAAEQTRHLFADPTPRWRESMRCWRRVRRSWARRS
jgi:PAS domain-containing protein